MNTQIDDINKAEAWVVFSAQADMNWLKILKPGYRHCAVLMNDGKNWMTVDPLSNYMDVTVHHVPVDFDMPQWMMSRGHKLIKADIARPLKPAPWGIFTCVEAVKRVLGIHNRLIITPWQLYRYLDEGRSGGAKSKTNPQKPHRIFNPHQGDLAWEV
jgi:hypothetical protein